MDGHLVRIYTTSGKKLGYYEMVQKYSDKLSSKPAGTEFDFDDIDNKDQDLYIPLSFWFCRNPGLAYP